MGKVTFLVTVFALSYTFNSANGYGNSGRGSETTTPPYPDHDDNEEQWGGVGHGPPKQPGHHNDNYGESNRGNENDFAKEYHVERYGYPEGCVREKNSKHACNYSVEIKKDKEHPRELIFELSSHVYGPSGYVAVGLSKDQKMGEDHIVECIKEADGRTTYYHSWAAGQSRPIRLVNDQKVILMDNQYPTYDEHEKILTCKFTRPIVTHVHIPGQSPVKFDLYRDKYHILLTKGALSRPDSDKIGFHGETPLKTGEAYASKNTLGHNYNYASSSGRPSGNTGYRGQAVGNVIGSYIPVLLCTFLTMFY